MINENIKAKGELTLVLTDEHGNVKQTESKNLVVNLGMAFITGRMLNATAAVMSHMAVGTNATAAAAANTALGAEVGRVALSSSTQVTTTVANDAVQYVGTFGPGVGTGALTEAGIFNAASAGTMLARTTFAVVNKGALDSLSITWKVTIV